MTVLAAAKAFASKGISVVPTKANKSPNVVTWAEFQRHIPTDLEIASLFAGAVGVGAICGNVSGCLECIDFDAPGIYEKWRAVLTENGCADTIKKLVVQETPSGGHHAVYRCADGVQGNQKLAYRLDDVAGKLILIETRGEGGYFQACPSPGYKMVQGTWGKIAGIDSEERDALFSAARMFNEWVSRPYTHKGPENLKRPGDEYGAKTSWRDILEPAGWTWSHDNGEESNWVRPGKTRRQGIGATTNYRGSDVMKCFTSNAHPFEADATYTKFCAYATLEHAGNMVEAARALGGQGYGDRRPYAPPTPVEDNPDRAGQRWLRASQVKVEKIDWLWPLYIPIGEVTMIVGNPGDGKSTIAQAIVTAVTRGSTLFGDEIPQGCAVFLSAEQSVKSVTVPRFNDMGADLDQIILPDEVNEMDEPVPFVLDKSGVDELRGMCLAERPKVVVIDTVTAYIEASRDFNSANQTREWMRRLAEIARVTPCAVVLLGHLNKNSSAHPLMRILGSIDFVGASRSVLLVGKDPDDDETRGLAQIKSNVGPFGDPRGFSLKGGVFGWTDGSGLDANRMLQPAAIQAAKTTRDRCEDWVRSLFKDTNVVEAPTEDDGKIGGFTSYMVHATKKRLGIASKKDGMSGWCWTWGEEDVYRGGE